MIVPEDGKVPAIAAIALAMLLLAACENYVGTNAPRPLDPPSCVPRKGKDCTSVRVIESPAIPKVEPIPPGWDR